MRARGKHSTLLSLPTPCFSSGLFRSGSWVFLLFLCLLFIMCPNCACMQLFLVSYSFFVICSSRRCLSRCKHGNTAGKGPRLSHNYLEDCLPLSSKVEFKLISDQKFHFYLHPKEICHMCATRGFFFF